MGNCRGCVHVKDSKEFYIGGKDITHFRCDYAEKEFGGERWVADLEGCEVFKSVIPEEGAIEFLRDCKACGGTGKGIGSFIRGGRDECYGCSGTGKVEMFSNDDTK